MCIFSGEKQVTLWCGHENYRGNSSMAYHCMGHSTSFVKVKGKYIKREFCADNNKYRETPMAKA